MSLYAYVFPATGLRRRSRDCRYLRFTLQVSDSAGRPVAKIRSFCAAIEVAALTWPGFRNSGADSAGRIERKPHTPALWASISDPRLRTPGTRSVGRLLWCDRAKRGSGALAIGLDCHGDETLAAHSSVGNESTHLPAGWLAPASAPPHCEAGERRQDATRWPLWSDLTTRERDAERR